MLCQISKIYQKGRALLAPYTLWQNIRGGKLSRFLILYAAKAFPCMFCVLLTPIQYSEENMALTDTVD